MERDFMGLNSTDELAAVVKEEVVADGYKGSVYPKRSDGQIPFPNNSGTDAFRSRQVHSVGGFQIFSASNQANAVPFCDTFFKNHLLAVGQNLAGVTTKLSGGTPVTTLYSDVLPIGPIPEGITDLSVKPCLSTSQLTIFYAGSVNVFDDIPPEKAQAVMLLAGNYVTSNASNDKVESSSTKLAAHSGAPDKLMNLHQPINTSPNSHLSSPLSVSSHNGAQPASGSSSTDEILGAKTTSVPLTPIGKRDPPKAVNATMFSSAVPQARKASLARFFEKRKERVMNAAPYSTNNKLECFNSESNALNFSTSTKATM